MQHGHDNVVMMDHMWHQRMKFSLYPARVMDEWGNGMPNFMVLCESTTQADIAEWMLALQKHMQAAHISWRPSCFMVDDAQGEINAVMRKLCSLCTSACVKQTVACVLHALLVCYCHFRFYNDC